VEVAASSASYDLHDNLRVYRRNGVQEYIVWRTYSQQIDWFCLKSGEYQSLTANSSDVLSGQQFPGLWLASNALLSGSLTEVLHILQQGIASPEHQALMNSPSSNGNP
jgi:Uma2 family endonuclease